jgi:hypothetical protein
MFDAQISSFVHRDWRRRIIPNEAADEQNPCFGTSLRNKMAHVKLVYCPLKYGLRLCIAALEGDRVE